MDFARALSDSGPRRSQRIKERNLRKAKSTAQPSTSPGTVSNSSLSSQKTKVEVAKLNLEYAQKEAETRQLKLTLDNERAKIEIEENQLKVERELKLEEAKLKGMLEDIESDDDFQEELSQVKVERTREYVQNHAPINSEFTPNVLIKGFEESNLRTIEQKPLNLQTFEQKPYEAPEDMYYRTVRQPLVRPNTVNTQTEFSKFLIKKELLITRFNQFNDLPECYFSWKQNFLETVRELDVEDSEHLHLLTKYLGPTSSAQAQSLRNASMDPKLAIERIWNRLDERYGRPEMVDSSLKRKITSFPKIGTDPSKLYDLTDILNEIEALKADSKYKALLSLYDTSSGVNEILAKLPYNIQQKWFDRASRYKLRNDIAYPPFTEFAFFMREMCTRFNDPGLMMNTNSNNIGYLSKTTSQPRGQLYDQRREQISLFNSKPPKTMTIKKTDVVEQPKKKHSCLLHGPGHPLNACRLFREKNVEERKQILRDNKICFRCCETDSHFSRSCKVDVVCRLCNSDKHPTAMHPPENKISGSPNKSGTTAHGGEQIGTTTQNISAKCTTLCGEGFNGRSCAKTILINIFPFGHKEKSVSVYAVHDEQSNATLGSPALFDQLGMTGNVQDYSLSSCAGNMTITARNASRLVAQSCDGLTNIELPNLIECEIPNERSEIPTPDVARHYPHLEPLVNVIPPLASSAEIGLIIGRDVLEAHHVEQQILGPKETPFAQKLPLGWVIVGEVCLGKFHKPASLNAFKTHITKGERPSIFHNCKNDIVLKDDNIGRDVFKTTRYDDRLGLSRDDRIFLEIMNNHMKKDETGQWKSPLPFKECRPRLPDNRAQALKRAISLDIALKKNPTKQRHMLEFMGQVIETRAAEIAPPLSPGKEKWYLPLFGVYHPRKPDKIRGVFDSSVECDGHSLNSVLLSGPNVTNSLLGVLLRFRRDEIAVTTDVQQMFYSFLVDEGHRDFLRFFWYADNDFNKKLIEYRMRVHVFGNTPSPSVATYGLRKTVENAEEEVKSFVEKDFYVDDGLASCKTSAEAIHLVTKTKQILSTAKIKLHKIASNSKDVMNAFQAEDLAKNITSLDIFTEDLPEQASLGLTWDLNGDFFKFNPSIPEKPFTRRGVVSAVSSIFDPLGFLTPVIIKGRILVRDITSQASSLQWDEPLPEHMKNEWLTWKDSLVQLKGAKIPRMFTTRGFSLADSLNVYIYSDASEKVISAVAYMRAVHGSDIKTGFIMGKSKLAPSSGNTIPRLELCAAVLATELADTISEHLNILPDNFVYHTDSRVVLGYLNNRSRRFYTYVANRVDTILKRSKPDQWQYVSTQTNPADLGTRCLTSAENVLTSNWITGPPRLRENIVVEINGNESDFGLVNQDDDCEIRPAVQVLKIEVTKTEGTDDITVKFEKFSNWKTLVQAVSLLKRVSKSRKNNETISPCSVEASQEAANFIIRMAQRAAFRSEIDLLTHNQPIPASSNIVTLTPVLDQHGILRVGGRINKAPVDNDLKHPIIIPKRSHVAVLLVKHYHDKAKHQGRLITEALIRSNGYWIVSSKRLVSSILHDCVTCRRLRGKFLHQQMASLPIDRITPGAPFTSVGVDTFGPWLVVTRKTRGGQAESKRWAILFTCLATRAVHIELVEDMSSSAFINALRRFVAIRGPVNEFRSDRGTNFVGALDDIGVKAVCVEKAPINTHLHDIGAVWTFNPPHASHMGGSWERMIGIARKILDAMLLNSHAQKLTHEVLCTFMCEVTAIINSRPIAPISYDPENPEIITPAMLLTQKKGPVSGLCTSDNIRQIYTSQWKYVQILSNTFWKRWRQGYLQSLQVRQKWQTEQSNLKSGDVVLLQNKALHRNHWPLGIVVRTFPSEDGLVRSAEIQVTKDGQMVKYVRPITELILLID